MAPKNASPMKPLVASLSARWTLTTSAAAATSSGEDARRTPSSPAASSVRLRDQATTGMPKARARLTSSAAMLPSPTTPRVRPYRPRALLNSPLAQRPSRRAATLSGMRRSSAAMSPNASSATATEFCPGQFAT